MNVTNKFLKENVNLLSLIFHDFKKLYNTYFSNVAIRKAIINL
jgi:hypothetical protein